MVGFVLEEHDRLSVCAAQNALCALSVAKIQKTPSVHICSQRDGEKIAYPARFAKF